MFTDLPTTDSWRMGRFFKRSSNQVWIFLSDAFLLRCCGFKDIWALKLRNLWALLTCGTRVFNTRIMLLPLSLVIVSWLLFLFLADGSHSPSASSLGRSFGGRETIDRKIICHRSSGRSGKNLRRLRLYFLEPGALRNQVEISYFDHLKQTATQTSWLEI